MSSTSWRDRGAQAAKKKPSPAAKTEKKPSSPGHSDGEDRRPKPMPPLAGKVPAHYDVMTGNYYLPTAEGDWQRFPERAFGYELRRNGFFRDVHHDNSLSYLEEETLRIVKEQSVHFAGDVGGFSPGVHQMGPSKVLVTRGPNWIQPEQGDWSTLKDFFVQLLGQQAKYLFAWLKWSLDSIRRGLPWSPGQMLAIAGPGGSGKSLCQSLLTPLLGGRVSAPYKYMIGETNFNDDLFGSEHAAIGDKNHAVDIRSRRNFGSAIKDLVCNKEQRIEGKHKTAATLFPFLRLSITLNDNPEALLVLPPLDSDIRDKIILLHSNPVQFPWPSKKFADSQGYFAQLVREMPAMLFALRRWRIPPTLCDQRYGVVSYLNPHLVEEVEKLSPERKLWEAIETYIFGGDVQTFWEGSSADLERDLEIAMKAGAVARLFPFSTACGVYLAKLEKLWPLRVSSRDVGGRKRIFTILKEGGTQ